MSMAMGTSSMSTAMDMTGTASSAMASMTGMSGMSGSMGDGGNDMAMSSGMMSMADMMMVFFFGSNTPLYSASWTPNSMGQYAGTCIFLIALAALFRSILAIRSNFSPLLIWLTHTHETEILRADFDKTPEERAAIAASQACAPKRPWKINEAVVRAVLDTVLAGVSYLLMLAVMTMNVGYFLSILGGTFIGSFIFGGYTAPASH